MKRAFLGLVLFVACASLGACTNSLQSQSQLQSKCEKAVENVMAKCDTCFGTSTSSTSSRGSESCREALLGMCGVGSSSSSSSSAASPEAFLDCVAYATSCDGILLCN